MQHADLDPPPLPPAIADRESPDAPDAPDAAGRPGALRGVVTLTLETHQAQRLVKGRPGNGDRPAIIGLLGFATLLRTIWHGVRADDPYADWWLVRVHDALETADQLLQESLAATQRELAANEAIQVTPGASVKPVRTPLRFSNPYAFRAARLLAVYDRLVRASLTARHIGLLTRNDTERWLARYGRDVRRALFSPVGYRLTGITRADVRQRTARYAQAAARMGEVPEEVLSGRQRAPYAPAGPMSASPLTPQVALQPATSCKTHDP